MNSSLTFAEVVDLPVMVDLPTAARALGISRRHAYQLARSGALPCSVVRVGGRYRIPTADLMRVLGVDQRVAYSVDCTANEDGVLDA